jgi:hypothetical protein
MTLTGHQPNYLPYLGFFNKIAQADCFCIVDNVQFVKRGPFGWQHRNKIRTEDGWMWLSVPILTKGRFDQKISQARINNRVPWQRKHWRSIYLNYHKSPYFSKYADFFESLYKKEWDLFCDLSISIICYLIEAFGIEVKIVRQTELLVEGKGTELIINLCKALGADRYISGPHGRDYLDTKKIESANIELVFADFKHPVYSPAV